MQGYHIAVNIIDKIAFGIDIEEYTTASTKRFNEPVNISREMFFKLWNKLKFISYIEKGDLRKDVAI